MIIFLSAKFGLLRPFRSRVMLRHGTDGQTDTAAQSRMPPPLRGRRHNNECTHSHSLQYVYLLCFGIRAEWTWARRRGHTGTGLTQRTSAVYAMTMILCAPLFQ